MPWEAKMAKVRKARRGLTFLEVMIALMLLSSGVLMAGTLFPAATMARTRSSSNSMAATIIQRKLEQVRRLPAASITYSGLYANAVIDSGNTSPYSFTAADSVASKLQKGKGTLTLTNPGGDLVTISVTVTWENSDGPDQTLTAVTNVSSREVWTGG
jgi:prepilin-type N-terminal cleavage/methylation domain-containing protein